MSNLFTSIIDSQTGVTISVFVSMMLASIVSGFVISLIMSFKMESNKRFFISNTIMPAIVAMVIALINGNFGVAIAVGGAFGLVRFRSAQGTSEEIAAIFISVASGVAFGMGYIAYGLIFSIVLALLYVLLTISPVFTYKKDSLYKVLKITIPEDLEYDKEFEGVFNTYTTEHDYLKIKTSDMGSLYKLDIKIKLKNLNDIKNMIDELRQRNGNMEVSVVPYINNQSQL